MNTFFETRVPWPCRYLLFLVPRCPPSLLLSLAGIQPDCARHLALESRDSLDRRECVGTDDDDGDEDEEGDEESCESSRQLRSSARRRQGNAPKMRAGVKKT